MAAMQTIRKHGVLLVSLIGLALFAFIAEEAVRSVQSTENEKRQKVGEVFGESIGVQEFSAMVDEYADFIKATRGISQLDEQTMTQLRDEVWNNLVQTKLIEHECNEAGISVCDAEVRDVIQKGNSQWLAQFAQALGMRTFDYTSVKEILEQYDKLRTEPTIQRDVLDQYSSIIKIWNFVEGRVRQEVLLQKFMSVMQAANLSSDIAAQAAFDDRTNQWDVVMASVPYSSIDDAQFDISDAKLKEKYNELKPMFKNLEEVRSVEVISVKVVASEADRKDLESQLEEAAATLAESTNLSKTVREARSNIAYSTIPVSRRALPVDIAARMDSMSVGQIVGPFVSGDNTMNVVRLVSKVQLPDSVEMRQIVVGGADLAAARKTADSIVAAINGGAPFDTIAAQHNQQGQKVWLTSAQYEGQALDADNSKYLNAVIGMSANQVQVVELTNLCIVVEVTDRRNIIDKYDVAIVKRSIDFSDDTYHEAYNKISEFIAENQTAELIRENAAKKNYRIQKLDVPVASHNVAGVSGTREAIRWIYNSDTKKNAVSPLYECGDNDNLMVIILDNVVEKGYTPYDNENVAPIIRAEVLKDAKAAMLKEQMAGKSIEEVAKLHGAKVDTLNHISLAGNVYVASLGVSERNIAGALDGKKPGDLVSAVKGESGVYTMSVLASNKTADKFDVESERRQLSMMNYNYTMQGLLQRLLEKAEVVDHRYLFY